MVLLTGLYLHISVKYYDVLISSYMRSGSTLTGIILGWRADTFYLYEPFWKVSQWAYWHGNDTVCRSDYLDCRKVEPGKAVQDKSFPNNKYKDHPVSLVMAMKILRKIYSCQFDGLKRTVFDRHITVGLGGPSWSQMRTCMKSKGEFESCLQSYIPQNCKNATHRVAKVLRLSVDLLEDILRARKNLKVIHLFRDPRAIINSRIERKWYPPHKEERIIENAKTLCNKMLYDFQAGQKLSKLYPDRFMFVYYEDLSENPSGKSKELFKYFGMNLEEHKYRHVKKLSVFNNAAKRSERQNNTAFWWRKSLKWDIVQKMEPLCKDVFTELGYKIFTNVQEYQNLSTSSITIPNKYLILKVKENASQD
ncbi:carbohydrate sulfotransferase 1-like [Mercenaria mercenaria]|uniref:carbohydrate sulfotransferase 1-like n=1 Tax=Mercenaria mercenaria TaxID=6596 RepID=UPI00234E739C|nr:carbohydrate sulfotransferase 1-like [Mercenaria mercenaria]